MQNIADRKLVCKIQKVLLTFNDKKTNNPMENGQKI